MVALVAALAVLTIILLAGITALLLTYERRFDRVVSTQQGDLTTLVALVDSLCERVQAPEHPDLAPLLSLVGDLCQRIQAPQVAVAQHAAEGMPGYAPEAVNPEVDEDYWAAQLSKEELADMVMAAEAVGD